MKRKISLAFFTTASVAVLALGIDAATSSRIAAFADEPDEMNFALAQDDEDDSSAPLILSPDEEKESQTSQAKGDDVEELPSSAVQKTDDELNLTIPDQPLDESEMQALSRQPLFKEFANIIDETAPLPGDIRDSPKSARRTRSET